MMRAAGNITIEGTADITYLRRHLLISQEVPNEKIEHALFKLEVALIENNVNPSVTRQATMDKSVGGTILLERSVFGTASVIVSFCIWLLI